MGNRAHASEIKADYAAKKDADGRDDLVKVELPL
jgi:hypothetical protein